MERHLIIQELSLRPSGEWEPGETGWTVARVAEGFGYCRQNGTTWEVNQGDVFIAGPRAAAVFRASQLGIARLEFFLVQPQCLNGLLTVTEWSQLEAVVHPAAPRIQHFPATELAAQKFTRLAAQTPRDSLAVRTALLQLWAAAINGLLPAVAAAPSGNKLRERFRQAIGQMSEADLAGKTLTQLATQLHCSERHFSRLFREEFGIALRARQTELRLQRARQLLVDSNAKIINVAYESGYRHLGLFNAMFKKRFGVTPSEWRQRHFSPVPKINPSRRAGIALAWLLISVQLLLASAAFAQTTNAPAAKTGLSTNVVQRFNVQKYQVAGNTILSPQKLGEIFTNVPAAFGTNVTLDDIRKQLGNLQSAYRERGYVTVSVSLPPQKLTNATVKVKVTEGRLSAVTVKGNNHYSTENVLRALPSLRTNMLLNSHVFQSELDAANANRDRQIYPVIGPGLEPGTSELTLKVKDRFPLHARVEFNNQATPGTPANRIAASAEYDNLWNLEHSIGVQYTFTPLNFSDSDKYHWSPLDSPLIANYSAYYRIPLGHPVSVQQQLDDHPGSFGYNEVTHQFQTPPSSGRPDLTFYASRSISDSGVLFNSYQNITNTPTYRLDSEVGGQNITLNEGLGTKFSLPLPAWGKLASTVTLGLDLKRYQQASYNTNIYIVTTPDIVNGDGSITPGNSSQSPSGQDPLLTEVNYLPVNLGLNGSMPDAWGTSFFNAQANYNLAAFGGSAQSGNTITHGGLSQVAHSSLVKDHYVTLQLGMDRVQRIYRDWTVKLHADGQWASGSLFSNEQYGMGGEASVRGYPNGQAYGDTGWRVSIEPQTPLVNIGMVDGDVPFYVRASVFMDYGEVHALDGNYFAGSAYLNGPQTAGIPGNPNRLDFWGAGWSLTGNIGNHLDARLTMAFPLNNFSGEAGWSPTHNLQIYFGIGAQF